MFGKKLMDGVKKAAVLGGALAALATVAALPASAAPNLVGRSISVNTTMQHDKTAGIDYTNTLKILTQDNQGNLTGTMVDKNNVTYNVSGKILPTSTWNSYEFSWQAGTRGKAIQFTGYLYAPVPTTQHHKVALFATGSYTNQIYSGGQWNTFGPQPMSLTADEYYVYTYPSGSVISANPGVIVAR